MFYTIYKITNNLNGKFYIGKHQTKNLQDGYMGSGKLIKAAIKKNGKENFTKEILHVFETEEEMNQAEKNLVVLGENSYNLCEGGKGGWGYLNDGSPKHIERCKYASSHGSILGGKIGQKIFQKQLENDEFRTDFISKISKGLNSYYSNGGKGSFLGLKHTKKTKALMSHKASLRTGVKNSQYGTCWITNGIENKKIKKDDLDNWISLGYYRGRI